MFRTRRSLLLFLIPILTFNVLACRAIPFFSSTREENNSTVATINQQQLVEQAVATIGAQLPQLIDTQQVIATPVVSQLPIISTDLEESLVNVYERVNPSVVNIFVYDSRNLVAGTGSGFVYDSAGYIVTNNHVVAGADGLEVVFPNGERRRAETVGTDVDSDLAVIKVDLPGGIIPVPLGDSRAIRVGQFAVALGNPFGEAGSYSLGIISGLGRTLTSDRIAEGGGRYSLPQVIQTDAAINPGNSGGPLLNLAGEVIGVNSAIRTSTGTNTGVGFAIPVNAVRRVIPALIADGEYIYPYMGISMAELDIEAQQQLGLPQPAGAYVTSVSPGTPADRAGIRPGGVDSVTGNFTSTGDLIIAVDNQTVNNPDDLISYLVFEAEVGQTINLTVIRNNERINVPLVLGERP